MKLTVLQNFSWAHQHVTIKEYAVGDVIETDDEDLIRVARNEGWAAAEGDELPAPPADKTQPRSRKGAPENKDAGPAPENK
jgi:hypothetical protein